MLAAAGAAVAWPRRPLGAAETAAARAAGYGGDPDLLKDYHPGDLWPLTLGDAQRRTAAALCGLIIPADAHSPGAAELKVHDFIDEWISAPYPAHAADRTKIVAGLAWIDGAATKRFARPFAELDEAQQRSICDEIRYEPDVAPELKEAAAFFRRFRDLTASGFYTTPEGMADIGYVGNRPSVTFDGPPPEVLARLGLDAPA